MYLLMYKDNSYLYVPYLLGYFAIINKYKAILHLRAELRAPTRLFIPEVS
jgi:hypothetical protein